MKAQICQVCLNSEILCPACQEKVDSGKVSVRELEIIRRINALSDKIKGIDKADIKGVYETDSLLAIVCSKGEALKLIGKGATNIRKLSKDIGKTVRIIEESSDKRSFLQNLIYPVPILSLNLVFSSEGEKYKVTVPNKTLPIQIKSFTEVASQILGKPISLEFQKTYEKKETVEDKIHRLVKKMQS